MSDAKVPRKMLAATRDQKERLAPYAARQAWRQNP
jgi:hypothetical protein